MNRFIAHTTRSRFVFIMNKHAKETVEFVIKDNKRAIKSPLPKIALKQNPNLLTDEQKKNEDEIAKRLDYLQKYYDDLLPFIKEIKQHIKNITEETPICAAYLLLSSTARYWESIFLLVKNGDLAFQNTLRTIKESLALTDLFALEFRKEERKYLDKWFSGEIISHGSARQAHSDFFMEDPKNSSFDLKSLAAHIYQIESQSSHNSYATMLECVSPFTEDFDFEKYTRYARTKYAMDYLKGSMDATNITLKSTYLFLIQDEEKYEKLDEILIKYKT